MLRLGIRTLVASAFVLSLFSVSCISPADFLNPDLATVLGGSSQVASLPEEAPGLLVWTENRTNRIGEIVISYRDAQNNVEAYTTLLAPGDKTGQMLVCAIEEITVGSVSDLTASGARVALQPEFNQAVTPESVTTLFDVVPYIEVEPFGVLLREEINYNCGDSIVFTIETSNLTPSGYRIWAYFREANVNQTAP